MQRSLILIIVGGFLLGAIVGAGLLVLNTDMQPRVETSGKALIGGPFTLVGKDGKPVTDKAFRGKYMLVFFGYTHCPDVCPAELQVMAAALDGLGKDADKVVPIFITVDPDRDTPRVVGDYVMNFGPRFVGLSGTPEQIAKAAKAYRVTHDKHPAEDGSDNYSVDHSAIAYLMGPDGEYITHIPYGTPAPKMTEILRRYL
jgi:protein SCO1/2